MYKIIGYCKDCTGYDSMGCNDGKPFDLGEKENIEDARKIGKNHADSAGPYYSEIWDSNGELIEIIN